MTGAQRLWLSASGTVVLIGGGLAAIASGIPAAAATPTQAARMHTVAAAKSRAAEERKDAKEKTDAPTRSDLAIKGRGADTAADLRDPATPDTRGHGTDSTGL